MNEYKKGDFGYFEYFTTRKLKGETYRHDLSVYGTIIDQDAKFIMVSDSQDGEVEYLIAKRNITTFKIIER